MNPIFAYGGLALRLIEPADLERLRALRNHPSTWINLTSIQPITAAMQEHWYAQLASANDRTYFAIADDHQEFIGIVRCDEIDRLNRSARIGCDIVPELRGQRYGSRTFDLILRYFFHFQNMHRLWLLVLDTNAVAIRLYTSKGLVNEGAFRQALFRDGQYHDYILMSLLEDEYRRLASAARSESDQP